MKVTILVFKNRVSCNIYHFYKYLGKVNGYAAEYRPFYCYHYYHGNCLEDWKLFHLKQNKGYCRYPVRDVFDNLCACKWKVDGPGVKLPAESNIENVNLDDSENIEETDTPNWREQQNLAIKDYNTKPKLLYF